MRNDTPRIIEARRRREQRRLCRLAAFVHPEAMFGDTVVNETAGAEAFVQGFCTLRPITVCTEVREIVADDRADCRRVEAKWGSLIALEVADEIVLGETSSPAQDRRWWATRGEGAFTGRSRSRSTDIRIHVSTERRLRPDRFITLPAHGALPLHRQQIVEELAGGPPVDRPWSHANRIAESRADVCVWFCGDIWDHAAPSILVEEAGGRFSDHSGGRRLDTRTAIYSNGERHDEVLTALARS